MDIIINGRAVYAYYPYASHNVVNIVFPDGELFQLPASFLKRLGYDLSGLPVGDRR